MQKSIKAWEKPNRHVDTEEDFQMYLISKVELVMEKQ